MTTSRITPLVPIGVRRTDRNDCIVYDNVYAIPAWQGQDTPQWFDVYSMHDPKKYFGRIYTLREVEELNAK
jgi:hypothetical protein